MKPAYDQSPSIFKSKYRSYSEHIDYFSPNQKGFKILFQSDSSPSSTADSDHLDILDLNRRQSLFSPQLLKTVTYPECHSNESGRSVAPIRDHTQSTVHATTTKSPPIYAMGNNSGSETPNWDRVYLDAVAKSPRLNIHSLIVTTTMDLNTINQRETTTVSSSNLDDVERPMDTVTSPKHRSDDENSLPDAPIHDHMQLTTHTMSTGFPPTRIPDDDINVETPNQSRVQLAIGNWRPLNMRDYKNTNNLFALYIILY